MPFLSTFLPSPQNPPPPPRHAPPPLQIYIPTGRLKTSFAVLLKRSDGVSWLRWHWKLLRLTTIFTQCPTRTNITFERLSIFRKSASNITYSAIPSKNAQSACVLHSAQHALAALSVPVVQQAVQRSIPSMTMPLCPASFTYPTIPKLFHCVVRDSSDTCKAEILAHKVTMQSAVWPIYWIP